MKAIFRCLILGVLLLVVAACGAPAATPAAPEVAAEPTAAPEAEESPTPAPAQTGIVTVGIDPSFEPFVFAKDGKLSGFDVDLLNAMAADGDFEVAYVVSDFDEIFAGLQSGKYDAAISAITITDARKEIVDFTEPYFESGNAPVSFYNPGQGIAIRTDNTAITGPESLTEGVRVGVKSGTTGAEFAAENTTAELVEFVESKPALDALTAGEVDAVIVDIPVIVGYIKSNPNAGLRVTGGPVTEEAYGIAVSKDKPEVLAKLNEALARVRGSDQYATLFNTWFGTP